MLSGFSVDLRPYDSTTTPRRIQKKAEAQFYTTNALFIEVDFLGAQLLEMATTVPSPKGPRLRKMYLVKQNIPVTFP